MKLELVPLQHEHLEDAAGLVTARYRALRKAVPELPGRYEDAGAILPPLRDLAERAPGVAAIRGGRLAGFLVPMVLPNHRGKRAVYSPEWANGAASAAAEAAVADSVDSREIYRQMYGYLSAGWVADGCSTHLITLLAHDRAAIDGWHWLGFGLTSVDAIRDLSPVPEAGTGAEVRRGGLGDVELSIALDRALRRHLASAPIFLPPGAEDGRERHAEWLADPANALWLAYQGAEAVACMGLGPANRQACYIIRDGGTASIVRAYTDESQRSRGIGTALLNRSLDWARSAGYERCAVDFEPQNLPGARFWMRHFQPICYSLVRHVDLPAAA